MSTSGTTDPAPGSWAWWRQATIEDIERLTGSRVVPRLLLSSAFWLFILTPHRHMWVGAAGSALLILAAAMVVVRRTGWAALAMPLIRPMPFMGYGLWIYFAPPPRRSAPVEWLAWAAVSSPFAFALLPG